MKAVTYEEWRKRRKKMRGVTYEEWHKNTKPRIMWVWNDDFEEREKKKVLYVIKDDFVSCPVLAVSEEDSSFCIYRHCAEIEESKTRRMTKQELAWWLQDGKHREWKFIDLDSSVIHNTMFYIEEESNDLVGADILIRENGGEWHEPLAEVEE